MIPRRRALSCPASFRRASLLLVDLSPANWVSRSRADRLCSDVDLNLQALEAGQAAHMDAKQLLTQQQADRGRNPPVAAARCRTAAVYHCWLAAVRHVLTILLTAELRRLGMPPSLTQPAQHPMRRARLLARALFAFPIRLHSSPICAQ